MPQPPEHMTRRMVQRKRDGAVVRRKIRTRLGHNNERTLTLKIKAAGRATAPN